MNMSVTLYSVSTKIDAHLTDQIFKLLSIAGLFHNSATPRKVVAGGKIGWVLRPTHAFNMSPHKVVAGGTMEWVLRPAHFCSINCGKLFLKTDKTHGVQCGRTTSCMNHEVLGISANACRVATYCSTIATYRSVVVVSLKKKGGMMSYMNTAAPALNFG